MNRALAIVTAIVVLGAPAAAQERAAHPLDPLSAEEIAITVGVLRDAGHVDGETRFPSISLSPPEKGDVLAWTPGATIPRRSFVVVKQGAKAFESTVDVAAKKVVDWHEVPGVQTSILLEEFFSVGEIVKASAEWQAAMKKRGFESFDKIYCGPLAAGYFGVQSEEGRRLVRSLCFDSSDAKNFWGRPIEGLVAIVDLARKQVVKVIDEGVAPVPRGAVDYDAATVGAARKTVPLRIEEPQGHAFKLDGNQVQWEKWRFHVRVDPRAGLVVALVRYDDESRLRSVLYEGSLSEIFVPYNDPSQGWYFRTYIDAGEYGVGKLAVPLEPGADCPSNAVYLADVLADDHGAPQKRERVACIFERPGGVAWRHYDFITNASDSRRARELVVRQIAAVGNYDYIFDWTFQEDGTIRVGVGATGIAEVKGVEAKSVKEPGGAKAAAYGHYVAEHTVAVNHDHFLSFRLDVDVDGEKNSFVTGELRRQPAPPGTPRKSLWLEQPRTLHREQEAKLHMSMEAPALWRVVNPSVLGPLGYPVGYELLPGHTAMSLLDPADFPSRRAGFAQYTLWVTPRAAGERWAAGPYPNQSKGGDGLPAWTRANRSIENTDVVLWYTLGFHHLVRAEDWPVMPTSWHEFALRPFDFFARNPALDLPKQ
ncbi:MAG TPA: primary-amine oxidase [Candidatus Binatia bacterium]|nr:primary-amine oxidase [Candidatus Binatia bacterium]